MVTCASRTMGSAIRLMVKRRLGVSPGGGRMYVDYGAACRSEGSCTALVVLAPHDLRFSLQGSKGPFIQVKPSVGLLVAGPNLGDHLSIM